MPGEASVRRLHMHIVIAVTKKHLLLKHCSLLVSALPSQACPQTGTPAADTGPMGPDEGPRMNGEGGGGGGRGGGGEGGG